MDAMRSGKADAPRPKRKSSGRTATTFMERPKSPVMAEESAASAPSSVQRPVAPPPKPSAPVLPPPPPAVSPSVAATPSAPVLPPPVAAPKTPPPIPSPVPQATETLEDEAPKKGSSKWIMIAVAAVLVLGCGGISLAGAAWYLMGSGGDGPTPAPAAVEEAVQPAEEAAAPEPAPEEKVEEKAQEPAPAPPPPPEPPKPVKAEPPPKPAPAPKPEPAPKPAPTAKPVAAPKPSAAPTPSANSSVRPGSTSGRKGAPAGPARVSFKSSGRGKISCGDGTNEAFDGAASLEFDSAGLPVSCMVTIEKKKGVFSVERSMTVTCDLAGDEVNCH